MKYQLVGEALLENGKPIDAISVNHHWLPVKPNQKVETAIIDGYRYILVDGEKFKFHREMHEVGRPHLLSEITELMAVISI